MKTSHMYYGEQQLNTGQKIWSINWLLISLIGLLVSIGLLLLFSISKGQFDLWALRHLTYFGIGLGLVFIMVVIPVRVWMVLSIPLYFSALLLLFLVPFFGETVNGSQRWLSLGGVNFQPSEFMKITLIMILASYYQWLPVDRISHPLSLLLPLILIAVPAMLVLKQPDLGTTILLLGIGATMLFAAGVNLLYFIAGGIGLGAVMPVIWTNLQPYQQQRVLTFLSPESDPLGAGYHILQAKIALGSGGLWGRGFMQGSQTQLDFLPEKHTDFIFTMLAEEFGFVGGVFLLIIFMGVLMTLYFMMWRTRHRFGKLVITGVLMTIFLYLFINSAMVMGLVPVVGVPLPFVSYGGTAMISLMFGVGLSMCAYVNRNEKINSHDLRLL